jgi:arginase
MADVILQGFCYDVKSSFMHGAAQAPTAIREVLENGAGNFFTENQFDLKATLLEDKGDFAELSYFDIEKITRRNIVNGVPIISLGGDHSITFPVVKAVADLYGVIDILHIDAHTDLYDEYEGDKYSHACPFARIMEECQVGRLVQVGIRSMNQHHREQADKFGVEIREMRNLRLDDLSEFDKPLYISLDMDGLDPAFAPGVSHHEPGGLSPRQVFDLINQIKSPIIGADIVEYNPNRDIHDVTGALAAKLLKEIWGRMVENNR